MSSKNSISRFTYVMGLFLLIAAIIAVSCLVFGNPFNDKPPKTPYEDPGICLTPGCIHAASKVLDAMDRSVEPCDDFYKFSCGSFEKKTNIPDDKTSVNIFSVINDALLEQLRTMIEEPIQKDELKPFRLVKQLYKACMNKKAIEADGLETILGIMRGFGGWPVLDGDSWKEESFDWKETVYKFRKAGYSVDYFVEFTVDIDLRNSSRRIIYLDQANLGLDREYLIKGMEDKLVKAYYDYMVDTAVIFGANREVAKKELKESLEFEMGLANISLPKEKRRNSTALYNPISVKELNVKYPSIQWLKYINILLAPDTTIDENEIVIIRVPKYISDLEALVARTPNRAQANYMLRRVAATSVLYLNKELRDRQLQYSTIVTGKVERASRWKECIDTSTSQLFTAVGALYVKKYFHEDARQNAIQMVTNIRSAFLEIVKQVDWMDEKTKQSALEKADAMVNHIAYPDELLDNNKLNEFYGNLELDSNLYLKSILNLTLFWTRFANVRLRQPVNESDWIAHGNTAYVNAFYSFEQNSIQVPAGILQGGFFDNDRPKYMNYGAIGFVIGHEITHGFDDQGRQFDKNGNLVDWWARETQQAFVKKTQCIIDQYGNYTVPEVGLNLNGISSQGENIADNGGIKTAYRAYNTWAQNNDPEQRLPGLDLTQKQLFWVSAGQTWCAKYRVESLKLRIVTGQHLPGYFRVVGPLRNLDEFAEDFKCAVGTKMNPKNKCKVW